MPGYLTTDAKLDFPGPTVPQAVAQVLARYKHKRPVTTLAVARALGVHKKVALELLQRAAQLKLVTRVGFQGGWIPPITHEEPSWPST